MLDVSIVWIADMTTSMDNPYAAPAANQPATDVTSTPRHSRWRIVPAAFSYLIGIISSVGTGAGTIVNIYEFLWMQRPDGPLAAVLIFTCLSIVFSASWLFAGSNYWNGKYRSGVIASGSGTLCGLMIAGILSTR
jgi:hypothetical protein